jgi:hypothetical protein
MRIRVAVAIAFLLGVTPAPAWGQELLFGVSDTGSPAQFQNLNGQLDNKVAGIQTFHPWGNALNQAIPRWRDLQVRPMLHISTADDQSGRELITPYGIARGRGDSYLLALNRDLRAFGRQTWVRPLGEVNRLRNPYGAFYPDGQPRDWKHNPQYYRQAFRRIALIVRGGDVAPRLRALGMPGLPRKLIRLPRAPVRIVWSPLPSNLGVPGNEPGRYWPGSSFVDLIGTSFFSAWPWWPTLNRFYRRFGTGKPFLLAEWGLNSDDPGFADRVLSWCQNKARCRALFFYRGFPGDQFDLRYRPESRRVLERRLSIGPYIPWAARR